MKIGDNRERVHLVWKIPTEGSDVSCWHDIGIYPSGELMAVCRTKAAAEKAIEQLESAFGDSMDDAPYRFIRHSREFTEPLPQNKGRDITHYQCPDCGVWRPGEIHAPDCPVIHR